MAPPAPSKLHEVTSVEGNVVSLKSYLRRSSSAERMCNDYVALLQLARELERIHSKNMAHGDIKPENITIHVGKNGVVFKLSTSNLKPHSLYKLWPDDVLALGHVFIQFLVKSLALSFEEPEKTALQRLEDWNHWATDVIGNMIHEDPSKRLSIGQVVEKLDNLEIPLVPEAKEHQILQFSRDSVIGRSNGVVYSGQFSQKDVAVKRIEINTLDINTLEREVRTMMHMEHPNVLQLFYADKEPDFLRLALELCDGNLSQLCANELNIGELVIDDRDGLVQMAKGLEYIHRQKLVHRDVKPGNILVRLSDSIIYKISDFGYTKRTSDTGSHSVSAVKGTQGFFAPEQLGEQTRGTTASDVFALGIVFHFFLPSLNGTRGIHPFKTEDSQNAKTLDQNIRDGEYKIEVNELWAELIKDMIQGDSKSRPKISGVLHRLSFTHIVRRTSHDCYNGTRGDYVYNCAFDDTGQKVACALDGGRLAIFYCQPWKKIEETTNTSYPVLILKWDGSKVAAGCADGTVFVWDKLHEAGKVLKLRSGSSTKSAIWSLNWSPRPTESGTETNRRLACGSQSGNIRIWDTVTGQELYKYNHRDKAVEVVWVSPENLLSLSTNGEIKLCNLLSTLSKATIGLSESIGRIFWNPEAKKLVSCSKDGNLKIWAWNGSRLNDENLTSKTSKFPCFSIDWSKDQTLIARGGYKFLKIWNNSLDIETELNRGEDAMIVDVSFSPDGQYLAAFEQQSSRKDCRVVVWKTSDWTQMSEEKVRGKDGFFNCLAWDPSSKYLAIANRSREVAMLVFSSTDAVDSS